MDKKSKRNLNPNLKLRISKKARKSKNIKLGIGHIFIGLLFVIYILNLIALIISIIVYFVYKSKYANETDTDKKNEYKSSLDKLDIALSITGVIFISPFMLIFAGRRTY